MDIGLTWDGQRLDMEWVGGGHGVDIRSDTMKHKYSLNSNLMTPDFPHNIRTRLVQLFFLLLLDVALSLPCWLSQFSFS
jgi:hypothetical protein